MAPAVFAVPIFFVIFRETLETVIIMSVLLAFLKQTLDGPNRDAKTYKKLRRQVWLGTIVGLVIVLIVAAAIIIVFYRFKKNKWSNSEYIYEGVFAIVAAMIITVLGAALLRVAKMQEKWRVKLAKAIEEGPLRNIGKWAAFKRWCERYVMFMVPFITVLREGVEAVVFVSGVSFSAPATSIPLPVVVGLMAGSFIGWLLYKGGASARLQLFLIISTCFLYVVAAGLFSRGIWFFEAYRWNKMVGGDAVEAGSGPGSYDIDQSVWHVNFGNPGIDGGGGWGIFNGILGWQNSATYGSVISYNLYWVVVITGFLLLRYKENTGHLPFRKLKNPKLKNPKAEVASHPSSGASSGIFERNSEQKDTEKLAPTVQTVPARTLSEDEKSA